MQITMGKGFRAADGGEKKMASLLLLLSSGVQNTDKMNRKTTTSGRVFECKTCDRRFPTFQALGGHRTSHKRPRVGGPREERMIPKPRVHECSICGLEFPTGQALGGHMRRHKPTAEAQKGRKDGAALLDLNLPPLDGGMELRDLGFEVGSTIDFLGCSE